VNMSKYDNSDYEITASGFGLVEGFEEMENKLKDTDTVITAIQTELSQTKRELNACIGAKDRTIVLTSDDFDNVLWNGTSFAKANSTYNGFVVPIYPGERIRYTARYANYVCTLTDYPTIGSSERVRTKADFNDAYTKGDFIVQDNEHYLFLNTTVATHDSYEVVGGKGALNVQLDGIRELQNPLNGKTIVCFGDSLTEFNGIEGKGYGDYLAELSGATVVRGGIGGTQLATRKEPVETIPDTDIAYQHAYGAVDISNLVKAWANNDWGIVDNAIAWLAENRNDNNSAVIERLKANPIENTDIVIVFGGSNDLSNSTFGSPNDTNPLQNTCGGINQIIDSILSVKPNMTIYFFTPIPRMATSEVWCDDYRTDQSDAYGSLSFPSLVKRIKECVEYNHIPCCDMYNTIGINRKNIYTYADDGVHPNRGYSILANKMYSFILANKIWS
ncbi:MAG: SGNH/GDSL hydrolase family protein, partial [Paraprevotella sp.]|nr:SGNH/GDSL hydrolase family protein [Paraprevotella sp.]